MKKVLLGYKPLSRPSALLLSEASAYQQGQSQRNKNLTVGTVEFPSPVTW